MSRVFSQGFVAKVGNLAAIEYRDALEIPVRLAINQPLVPAKSPASINLWSDRDIDFGEQPL